MKIECRTPEDLLREQRQTEAALERARLREQQLIASGKIKSHHLDRKTIVIASANAFQRYKGVVLNVN